MNGLLRMRVEHKVEREVIEWRGVVELVDCGMEEVDQLRKVDMRWWSL